MHSEIGEVEEQQARLARLYVAGSMAEEVLEAEGGRLRERRTRLETELRALIEVDQIRDVLPAVAERLRVWVARRTSG